jgi:hypothetical protein
MGNNEAFSVFEATVIAVYDTGLLDQDLLSKFMEIHRGSDIDLGGGVGARSKDGLDVEEIVLKVFGEVVPTRPNLPQGYATWSPAEEQQNKEYWEQRSEAFAKISHGRFGWR